jgi:hypothetical protein
MLIPRDFDHGAPESVPLPLPKPAADVAGAPDKGTGKPGVKVRRRADGEHPPRRPRYRL